jgi:hypothetical protein
MIIKPLSGQNFAQSFTGNLNARHFVEPKALMAETGESE